MPASIEERIAKGLEDLVRLVEDLVDHLKALVTPPAKKS